MKPTIKKYFFLLILGVLGSAVSTAQEIVLPPGFKTHVTDLCAEILIIQEKSFKGENFFELGKQLYEPVVFDVCKLSTERAIIYSRRIIWAEKMGDVQRSVDAALGILEQAATTPEMARQARLLLILRYFDLKQIEEAEAQIRIFKKSLSASEENKYAYELLIIDAGIATAKERFDEAALIGGEILKRIESTGEFPVNVDVIHVALELADGAEVNLEPKLFNSPKPVYPWSANNQRVSGYVIVIFDIDEGGRVTHVEVEKEEPEGLGFAEAALEAARRQIFSPLIINGVALPKNGLKTKFNFKGHRESPFSQ